MLQTTGPMPPRLRLLLLGLTGALLIALLRWDPQQLFDAPDSDPPSSQDPDVPEKSTAPPRRVPTPPAPVPRLSASCTPSASTACLNGDRWSFDSCGQPEALVESCASLGCGGDRCLASTRPDPRCVQVSAYGVCEGEHAIACIDNRVLSIDCSAKGQRCVTTREGARCLPRDPNGCSDRDRPRCVGETLRECVDGLWTNIDCAARRSGCVSDGDGARCGNSAPLPPTASSLAAAERELCNGRDDDRDGKVDESDACKAVSLVAYVPQGARLTDLESRMAAELEIANRAFAPLQFNWAKQRPAPSELRVVDPDRLDNPARALSQADSSVVLSRLHPGSTDPDQQGLAFYIPVLFVERVRSEPPKGGLSTLPNSTCGGVRISDAPSPPYGLVVLADQRAPTSLSHELGHYLGLCHTHEELARVAAAPADLPVCRRTGDGICDTAQDPGPNACGEVAPCDFYCGASSARPDASNLMSYYLHCRSAFSAEQRTEIARTLELRKGWFRCLDPQDCVCQPGAGGCPAEMSCHPRGPAAFSCELDGPGRAGTGCKNSSQCGDGAICMSSDAGAGRCVRPCVKGEGCTCRDVGLPFQVCAQDL